MSRRNVLRGLGRAFSTSQAVLGSRLVLGCGSNVVDHIYNVKVVPQAGGKGFFQSPFKALEKKLIGGVTLNHLAWASFGGVPTGLLALQGEDELGRLIRSNLKKLGVVTDFIKTGSQYSTAQCHVFIQEGGERSILMSPAATSLINAQAVQDHFDADIQAHASIVTTEISQVPLTGVLALLGSAKKAGVLSVLDLDVPPSVAVNEANLGGMDEVVECARAADILKPAKAAAVELLSVMTGREDQLGNASLAEMASELVQLCGCKLVALTNGGEPSILATTDTMVEVQPPGVERVVDTTGAGDAFLGGLIVGLSSQGLPQTQQQLRELGRVANGYGAACVQSLGGVPTERSSELLHQYLPDAKLRTDGELSIDSTSGSLVGFFRSIKSDADTAANFHERIDRRNLEAFLAALDGCQGQLLLSGIGKSGHVAQRFASSLNSVSISASFVHAAEWIHGDLGRAHAGRDMAVFLSHSGATKECVVAAARLGERGVATMAITAGKDSPLSKLCMSTLCYDGKGLQEPFGLLPTTSLVLQELLCNALLCELIRRKGIAQATFASNHPGGNIGARLS